MRNEYLNEEALGASEVTATAKLLNCSSEDVKDIQAVQRLYIGASWQNWTLVADKHIPESSIGGIASSIVPMMLAPRCNAESDAHGCDKAIVGKCVGQMAAALIQKSWVTYSAGEL